MPTPLIRIQFPREFRFVITCLIGGGGDKGDRESDKQI